MWSAKMFLIITILLSWKQAHTCLMSKRACPRRFSTQVKMSIKHFKIFLCCESFFLHLSSDHFLSYYHHHYFSLMSTRPFSSQHSKFLKARWHICLKRYVYHITVNFNWNCSILSCRTSFLIVWSMGKCNLIVLDLSYSHCILPISYITLENLIECTTRGLHSLN